MLLDIILVVLGIFAAIFGYKKGCVKIVSSIISFVLAFVLAYIFAKVAGEYIQNNTPFGDMIKNGVETSVSGYLSKDEEVTEETQTTETKLEQLINSGISNGKEAVVTTVTNYVFRGLGFVLVFVLVRIVLWIATMMLEGLFELPILNTINELGGLIASLILMALKICVVLAIINFMAPMQFMSGITNLISESVITRVLYEHNIIVTIIANNIM